MSQFRATTSPTAPVGGAATVPVPDLPPPPALLAGAVAALRAAAASFAVVLAPVVLYWIIGAPAEATWQQAVRVALNGWLLCQRAPIALADGGTLSLAPLGFFGVTLAACWFAGRWLSRTLDPRAAAVDAWRAGALGETRRPPRARRAPLRGLVVFVAGYLAITVVAALFAATPGSETGPGSGAGPFSAAVAGLFTVCLGGLPGTYAWPYPGLWPGVAAACADLVKTIGRSGPAAEQVATALRRVVPRWVAPTRDALVVVLGSGAALFLGALAAGWDDAVAVWSALDAGVVGGAGLALLNLALLPTAAVWAASFTIGPGFAMGAGTSLGPAGSSVGALPALPVFAAVPDPGLFPDRVWLVVLVPVVAGVVAGVRIARAGGGERRQLIDALGAGLLSGLVFAGLAWLSGGSLGAARMSDFGPSPVLSGLLLAGEIAVTALVTVVLWQTFRGRRPAGDVETPEVTQGDRVDGGF